MSNYTRFVTTLIAILAPVTLAACGGGEGTVADLAPASESDPLEEEYIESLAPIGVVSRQVAESFPPEYFVVVDSGLPNGCVELDRYEVKIEGTLIQVSIINREPVGGAVGCTADYRTVQTQIPLGSDLLPGTAYTLLINDVSETFVTEGGSAETEAVVESEAPIETPEQTSQDVPQVPASADDGCAPPAGWYGHVIGLGETMFELAQRSGSTVEDLATGNCIDDPSSLTAGETILLPSPVAPADRPAESFATFFLVMPGDGGLSGPAVGCGDSLVAVSRARPISGELNEDIGASLEELFAVKSASYDQTGYTHSFPQADLSVTGVALDGAALTVTLAGQLQLTGVCADALLEAQILYTIYQYQGFDTTLVMVGDMNLKRLLDNSGTITDDALYARADFPLP